MLICSSPVATVARIKVMDSVEPAALHGLRLFSTTTETTAMVSVPTTDLVWPNTVQRGD